MNLNKVKNLLENSTNIQETLLSIIDSVGTNSDDFKEIKTFLTTNYREEIIDILSVQIDVLRGKVIT